MVIIRLAHMRSEPPVQPGDYSRYVHLSLLQFLVGDLGNGQLDMKLKVYKGTTLGTMQ